MSMLMSARRRQAQDLQALLDGARPSTPAAAEELAPLVAVARSLTPAPYAPREQFRAALRERLVAEAEARPAPTTADVPRQRGRQEAPSRVRQAIAAATLASLVGGIGVAAASTRALPGEALYGLKRQVENAQLAIARGDLGRGRELLEQANARLSEAEALAAGEDAGEGRTRALIARSLQDMDAALTQAVVELTEAYRASGDEEPLLLLDRFVTDQRERLADLMALLDPRLRDRARSLADQLAAVDQSVSALLGEAGQAAAASAGVPFGTDASDGSGDDRPGLPPLGGTGSAGDDLAGTEPDAGGLGGLVGSVGGSTGGADPGASGGGTSGSGSTGGGSVGGVGGVLGSGGTASTQLPTAVPTLPAPLPTAAPVPASPPVVSNPLPSITSAAPLPSVPACVPVAPLTTC